MVSRANGCFKGAFVSGLFSYPLGNFSADGAKALEAEEQTISLLFSAALAQFQATNLEGY